MIVWACRGGLKTLGAGVVSHLECEHKPGCEIRALGGSGEQSRKMYNYFVKACEDLGYQNLAQPKPNRLLTRFKNRAMMSCLTQSTTAVRGEHVPKFRCDEYDEFTAEVIKAVQNATSSREGIKSGLEMLSTAHNPYGPMMRIIDSVGESGIPVLKWCLFEVIEPCPPGRNCEDCKKVISRDENQKPHTFWEVCQGKAKKVTEKRFPCVLIEDIHKIFKRSTFEDFQAENLCLRPRAGGGSFYKAYDDRYPGGVHIIDDLYNPEWDLYEAYDGGYHHPRASIYQKNKSTDQIILIDEYAPENVAPSTFVEGWWKFREEMGYKPATYQFCDPSATDLIAEFKKFAKEKKITWIKIIRAVNDHREGARRMREVLRINEDLGAPLFLICQKNKVNRKEMRELHFPEVRDGKEEAEWHVEVDDHGPDTNRYMVASLPLKEKRDKQRADPERPEGHRRPGPEEDDKEEEPDQEKQ